MRSVMAQTIVETKLRLRSTLTIFAVLGVFALSFLYLPDPEANRVSISWRSAEGALISGVYDSTYVGAVISMLSSLFMTLIGFYLVAGSIRRDRERHVLEIVAATPVSRFTFLVGKWLAHTLYLTAVAATSLVAGLILFLRFGEGPLDLQQFLMPWVLTVPGAMAFTAALAIVFDVTPLLRSRAGWVVWFFTWIFVFMFIPADLSGRSGPNQIPHPTSFDPGGGIAFEEMIESMAGEEGLKDLSIGIMIIDEPVTRARLGTIGFDQAFNTSQIWTFVWSALLLVSSALLFRFKPSRSPRRAQRRSDAPAAVHDAPPAESGWVPGGVRQPSFAGAVVAEARLTWLAAGLLKWPFLLASVLSIVLPSSGAQVMGAIALILLAPIIAEVAAREQIAGTGSIVLSSPSVPRSVVVWKLAALSLFVAASLAPLLIRAFIRSPQHGMVLLLGSVGTVMLATGLGALTGGGKFFTGVYVVAWYMALQQEAAIDFTGWFVPDPSIGAAAVWFLAGLATVVPATLLRWRTAS